MRISVLTYNTADKQASLQSVHSIIQDNDSDIIFISLQEMYNLDSHFVIHKKGYTVSITKMIGMVSILLTKAHTKPKILKIGMGPFISQIKVLYCIPITGHFLLIVIYQHMKVTMKKEWL